MELEQPVLAVCERGTRKNCAQRVGEVRNGVDGAIVGRVGADLI